MGGTSTAPMPKRVLIISDAWGGQINGVVRTYQNIIAALEARNVDVRVIGPEDFRRIALPFYKEIELAILPARPLRRLIEDYAPDAIHIAVEGPLGWAAWRYCTARGVPFTTAFHTDFARYIALRVPKFLSSFAERSVMAVLRKFHNASTCVFVATARIEQQLRDSGFTAPMVRLLRGVDYDLFYPVPHPKRAEPPRLLYVGRVSKEKNIEAFLALPIAAEKIVVGDGPLLSHLRKAYGSVRFTGSLTGRALADAYRDADIFVFPSRTDTFGIVLIEALASGLPIAAFDEPGPSDIMGHDPTLGAISDTDLADAVRRALAAKGSPQERHDKTKARYSWPEVADVFHKNLVCESHG